MGAVRRNNETQVEAAALFPPSKSSGDEGSAWFWRLFGGTIMGAITFLLVTLLNHLNTNVDAIRNQQVSWQKEVQAEVSGLRDRIVKVEETISTMKENNKERKEMVDEQIKSIEEDLKDIHKELAAKQSEKN